MTRRRWARSSRSTRLESGMSHIECAKSLAALNECTMKRSFAELDFLRFARGTIILVQLPSC